MMYCSHCVTIFIWKIVSKNYSPIWRTYEIYVPRTLFLLPLDTIVWFPSLWLTPDKYNSLENRIIHGKFKYTENTGWYLCNRSIPFVSEDLIFEVSGQGWRLIVVKRWKWYHFWGHIVIGWYVIWTVTRPIVSIQQQTVRSCFKIIFWPCYWIRARQYCGRY